MPCGDPLALGADAALADHAARLDLEDLDLGLVGHAAGLGGDVGLGADAGGRAGHAPVGEHVVGEGLVVGHHVEVGVDVGAGLGDVDGDGDGLGRSHDVPHGTLLSDGWQGPAGTAARRRDRAHRRRAASRDLSLRELAAAIGTSHRMLIHHFGGREGLLVAVVRAVEQRQRALARRGRPRPDAAAGDAMRAWWRHISDPSLWPNERLFFELYGQALQGRPGHTELLDGIVDAWLEPAAAMLDALGLRATARRPRASASPSRAGCCSTCSPPATAQRGRRGDGGLHRCHGATTSVLIRQFAGAYRAPRRAWRAPASSQVRPVRASSPTNASHDDAGRYARAN